jgi:predicted nucleic acid-binding protein
MSEKSIRIVFDTEPLVAHIAAEPGAEAVEEYLDRAAAGDIKGFVSPVTLTEVLYVTERSETKMSPDTFLSWFQSHVNQVKASDCWREAARYKNEYNVALGDAYSLAAAKYVGAKLLVGADDDFDDIEDVDIVRFRDDAV